LLSAEQQAEADRHRILSTLDGKPAAAVAKGAPGPAKPRKPMLVWGVAGLGLIAVAAGALAWMNNELNDKTVSMTAAALPVPSGPAAAAVASAAPVASSAPAEPEVSTAAILNDAPAAPEDKLPSLKEMLSAPSAASASASTTAPARANTHNELAQALERPSPQGHPAHKAEHKAEHKTEHQAEPVRVAQKSQAAEHKARATEKAKYKPVPAPAPDSDVTLLAALMAHMQTPAGKKADSPAAQLKLCKQQNAAGEEQCRVRLCAGAARSEPECKAPPIAKVSADS
jgi:hypothetical protein